MLIGHDYPKIEWNIFDLHLLEPNAFFGDLLIALISFYYFRKITKNYTLTPFNNYWRFFYLAFAVSFIAGGLAHLLFHYWGAQGKFIPGFLAMLPPYFAEQAMVSIYPKTSKRKLFSKLSNIKLLVFALIHLFTIFYVDMETDPTRSTIVPALCSVIGLGISLGVLGAIYTKKIHPSFKYLWIAALILVPSALFQSFKISFSQYFDRNDASHTLLIVGLFLYSITLSKYEAYRTKINE